MNNSSLKLFYRLFFFLMDDIDIFYCWVLFKTWKKKNAMARGINF